MEFKHIILVNSEALQQVAFDVTVNMERMLNRRIPDMDICKWLYAAACDGCVPLGEAVEAVFVETAICQEISKRAAYKSANNSNSKVLNLSLKKQKLPSVRVILSLNGWRNCSQSKQWKK